MERHKTREIRIGNRVIGGSNPIAIQSMCNTKTENVTETVEQIHRLERAGCEIIRVAVPTMEAAKALREIKAQIAIPLWRTFILTTAWPSRPWRTGRIRSASTPETSDPLTGYVPWWIRQRSGIFPSAWASTAVP